MTKSKLKERINYLLEHEPDATIKDILNPVIQRAPDYTDLLAFEKAVADKKKMAYNIFGEPNKTTTWKEIL